MPETIRVAVWAPSEAALERCVAILGGTYEVIGCGAPPAAGGRVDLLLAEVRSGDPDVLPALAGCRRDHPDLPVLLLGHGLTPDLAVEVVRLHGDDLLSLPIERPGELLRKVERLLGGVEGPTLEAGWLQPTGRETPRPASERRRVFRADVPAGWRAEARLIEASRPLLARVVDLAISRGSWPGAIRLAVGRAEARALVQDRLLPSWGRGARIRVELDLEGLPAAIPVRCRVIRLPRPTSPDHCCFIVRYMTERALDEEQLVTFWTRCQAAGLDSGGRLAA